jgi:hypothetical protein
VDAFGNEVDVGDGQVKISVEPVDDVQLSGKELPKVQGSSQQRIVDGIAIFEKICLAVGVQFCFLFSFCVILILNN